MAKVGDAIQAANANWSFGGQTREQFEQHIHKSVPFYAEGHQLVEALSDFFLVEGSVCYDLGCSTGSLMVSLAERHANRQIQFIGIDCEADMAQQAQAQGQTFANIEIRHQNLIDVELEPADLIVAYYTMQFVNPKHRQAIFNQIYEALNWGGGLILFEKVRAPDARFQDMTTTLYTDFKLQQGYSGDEIVAKTRSLKGVLEPFSTAGNLGLLERAGFVDIMTVMKYVCFEGFLAIK
ncbi:Carboxy-S-adenosyl-L-methionine synthase [Acaryochloris thomasi RCC1774]|uniref:Carboxy-S-adenosyl-L-methionine synthase n=1 Tax=Acaryochloris thomasi RCC1774 TaxID=1764569 RepID=A0A2W1J8P0_9CYAN|nr:methyltransferase domain-containing protein [Acaryochloris thomasi]PZD70733.1 Carboxy-S-adenosyl-L-methionine synthase [Acaryochloris thomasi RCC1774]